LSILGAGEAIAAADKAIVDQYGNAPLTNEKAYCIFKRSALVLEQAKASVYAATEAVRVWEWSKVLELQSEWLEMGVQIVGIMKAVIDSLGLYGVDLPPKVEYFWGLVEKLGPYQGEPPEWDWSDLKGSVCYPKEGS
jgi:hypothetical protein